jgi:regulator of replication initiation timing
MTDDEIALWLITKGTMEDKPTMALAADRILRMRAERDEALECNEEFFVDNQILKRRVEETLKEWEGWQSASVKLMKQVTALTAERDRLREALTDAWDAHNKHGDQMSGWWVHDDALKGESHD